MRYFQNDGQTFGYDESDPSQEDLIEEAISLGWPEVSGRWPRPLTLAQARDIQNSLLMAACQTAIVAGFVSSALGIANTYPSDATSQGNIDRAAAHGGLIWCGNDSGGWSLVLHTLVQAQQVQADLWSHIQACQGQIADLRGKIEQATRIDDVRLVNWP